MNKPITIIFISVVMTLVVERAWWEVKQRMNANVVAKCETVGRTVETFDGKLICIAPEAIIPGVWN